MSTIISVAESDKVSEVHTIYRENHKKDRIRNDPALPLRRLIVDKDPYSLPIVR
jgi:hypothetical protein